VNGYFKYLNQAKFEVLNEMARNMVFGDKEPDLTLVSCNPFEKEWNKLKQLNAVKQWWLYNIVALRSSDLEFFVPNAFRLIFLIVLIIYLVPALWRCDLLIDAWRKFLNI
jgi:hypothetical protein